MRRGGAIMERPSGDARDRPLIDGLADAAAVQAPEQVRVRVREFRSRGRYRSRRAVDTAGKMAAIVISLAWRNSSSAGSAAPQSITPAARSAASLWLGRMARHREPHADGWMRGLTRPFARDGPRPGSPS